MLDLREIPIMFHKHSDYPFCNDCIDLIQSEKKFIWGHSVLVSLDLMYRGYKWLSQVVQDPDDINGPIEGFDFLFPQLEDCTLYQIRSIAIISKEVNYEIVCDEVFEKLFGILKRPGSPNWGEE